MLHVFRHKELIGTRPSEFWDGVWCPHAFSHFQFALSSGRANASWVPNHTGPHRCLQMFAWRGQQGFETSSLVALQTTKLVDMFEIFLHCSTMFWYLGLTKIRLHVRFWAPPNLMQSGSVPNEAEASLSKFQNRTTKAKNKVVRPCKRPCRWWYGQSQ